MSEPITFRLNGESFEVERGATLASLLANLGRDPRTVAIEHNGEIVRREHYPNVDLAADDQVEIVHFVQGGRSL